MKNSRPLSAANWELAASNWSQGLASLAMAYRNCELGLWHSAASFQRLDQGLNLRGIEVPGDANFDETAISF